MGRAQKLKLISGDTVVVLFTSNATEVIPIFIIIIVSIIIKKFDVFKGCLKIHMVDFDCKMGHGSNQDQLRNVMMIIM